jgi:hypothetical protein
LVFAGVGGGEAMFFSAVFGCNSMITVYCLLSSLVALFLVLGVERLGFG